MNTRGSLSFFQNKKIFPPQCRKQPVYKDKNLFVKCMLSFWHNLKNLPQESKSKKIKDEGKWNLAIFLAKI